MENIKKIFDKIKLEKHNSNDGKKFFDPTRNIFLQITPEEIVRQKMLVYLMKNLSVPSENILVEEHLAHWTKNFNGRIDIAITHKEKFWLSSSARKKKFLSSQCNFLSRRKIMRSLLERNILFW